MFKQLYYPVFFVTSATWQVACQLEPFIENSVVDSAEAGSSELDEMTRLSSNESDTSNTNSTSGSEESTSSSSTSLADTDSSETSSLTGTSGETSSSSAGTSTSGSASDTNVDESDESGETGNTDESTNTSSTDESTNTSGTDESDNTGEPTDTNGTSETTDASTNGSETDDDDDDENEDLCHLEATYTFEDGDEGWHSGKADTQSDTNSWERGQLQKLGTWGWATSIHQFYPQSESSYLASPEFSFKGCKNTKVSMRVKHMHQFSDHAPQSNPGDGGIIEISTDGGSTWKWIKPSDASYCSKPIESTFPPIKGQLGFCFLEENGEWKTSEINLRRYAVNEEEKVTIRFVFGSDSQYEDQGWFIDDIWITVKQ